MYRKDRERNLNARLVDMVLMEFLKHKDISSAQSGLVNVVRVSRCLVFLSSTASG